MLNLVKHGYGFRLKPILNTVSKMTLTSEVVKSYSKIALLGSLNP